MKIENAIMEKKSKKRKIFKKVLHAIAEFHFHGEVFVWGNLEHDKKFYFNNSKLSEEFVFTLKATHNNNNICCAAFYVETIQALKFTFKYLS